MVLVGVGVVVPVQVADFGSQMSDTRYGMGMVCGCRFARISLSKYLRRKGR